MCRCKMVWVTVPDFRTREQYEKDRLGYMKVELLKEFPVVHYPIDEYYQAVKTVMDINQITSKIREIVERRIHELTVNNDDILGIDSLDSIEILMDLEEAFDFHACDDEEFSKCKTINEMSYYVMRVVEVPML